jgi:hypothetical protein
VGFLVRISPYLRNGPGNFYIFIYFFLHKSLFFENILHNIIKHNFFLSKKKSYNKVTFCLLILQNHRDSKTARIPQDLPDKKGPCRINQIHQKSSRNLEPARNNLCPPDDFQIRQNFQNLADKTTIGQP